MVKSIRLDTVAYSDPRLFAVNDKGRYYAFGIRYLTCCFRHERFLPALLLAASFVFCPTDPPHRRRRAEERGQVRRRWLTYGLDQGETRYSPLNSDQHRQREPAGPGVVVRSRRGRRQSGRHAAVWNGTIYGITNWSVVFAVDARTGKERWRWDPEVNQTAVRAKICCGVVNRGVAIYQRQDHRADHRWKARSARCGNRQAGLGSSGRLCAGQLHASRWPRASRKAK